MVAHPDDARFQPFFGTTVRTPIFHVEVPVLAHPLADPEKGTGIAMICTFGDVTDVTWWRELNLESRALIGFDGRFATECPAWITAPEGQAAYAAIANKGVLMKSHVVEEVRWPDGKVDTYAPKIVRRVISERSAAHIGSMLISVVEKGHGKKAGVPGYWVAGKTGTAQIAQRGGGYEVGANIGTFAGYFPADAPQWAVVTRVDRPHDVAFAESSAAPLFHDIAQYLLTYHHLQPNR